MKSYIESAPQKLIVNSIYLQVQKAVNAATEQLAKAAFAAAQKNDSLSLATNSLLVHLGLIKCEVSLLVWIY